MIAGNCTSPAAFRSSGFSGMSDAPKVTVLALICLMPAARADRLIIETHPGERLVGVGPLGIDRVREGGARARDVRGRCRQRERREPPPAIAKRLKSVVVIVAPFPCDRSNERGRASRRSPSFTRLR